MVVSFSGACLPLERVRVMKDQDTCAPNVAEVSAHGDKKTGASVAHGLYISCKSCRIYLCNAIIFTSMEYNVVGNR